MASEGGNAGVGGCLVGCVLCAIVVASYYSCTTDSTYEMALVGRMNISKTANTYTIQYVNDIDNRKSQGTIDGDFDLEAVRTVLDAGVEKGIYYVYIPKECFVQIKNAYKTDKTDETKNLANCKIYAEVGTVKTYLDQGKYTMDMVEIKSFNEMEHDGLRQFKAHK